jgi:hypothetical protein
LTPGSCAADAENIFGRGIYVDNQQAVIKQYDTCAQAIEDIPGVFPQRSAAGAAAAYLTVLC